MGKTWYQKFFPASPAPQVEPVSGPADHGNAEVQFGLGLTSCSGAAPDYAKAMEWYHKAAQQNHSLAQFNLGVMYARGQGVPRDDVQSKVWIGKAAQQGDAGAQYILGMKHVREAFNGMPEANIESRIEGYKWLHLSAVQGYSGSNAACESLTMSMSREAVTEANRRVTIFQAAHPAVLPLN